MRYLFLITSVFIFQANIVFSDSMHCGEASTLAGTEVEDTMSPSDNPSDQPKVVQITSDSSQDVQQAISSNPFSLIIDESNKAFDHIQQAFDWDFLSSKSHEAVKDFKKAAAKIDLNQFASDASNSAQNALRDFKEAAAKINIDKHASDVGATIHNALDQLNEAASQVEIDKLASKVGQNVYNALDDAKQFSTKIDLDRHISDISIAADHTLNDVKQAICTIKLADLPSDVQAWIAEHPYQTAFYVANGVVFIFPGLVTAPILQALGFSSKGIRVGKKATSKLLLKRDFFGMQNP